MSHLQRFQQLGALLSEEAHFWRPVPFKGEPRQWQHPALHDALQALSDEQVDLLQGCDQQLQDFFSPFLPFTAELQHLCALERHQLPLHSAVTALHGDAAGASRWHVGVPGRKADQIRAFGTALGDAGQQVVEWCGGKGHLGRYLHACYGSRVDTLEIDSTLVREGEELARKLDYPQSLHECDVLAEPSAVWLKPETHLLGLHACGGLHVTMLEKGVDAGTCRISLSPCCYHLYGPEQYQPMSGSGRVTGLHLTREELRNAVRQTETAPARQRRQRAQMQSWRLGFDALQQQITGTGQYMPVPSLPTRLLKGSFEAFCRHCAELKGLSLAENLDFFRFEREGLALFRQRSREDLVRMLFRRPLEVWLALDRVLFLEENGYQCRLLQFCPPALTPRNLLLDAHR